MKIYSLDFDSICSVGGIAKFNRNLSSILGGDFFHISYFKKRNIFPHECQNSESLNVTNNVINKSFNYLSNYKLSSKNICNYVNEKCADYVIVNSPSFLQNSIKGKVILVQHQSVDVMLANRSNLECKSKLRAELNDKIYAFVALSPHDKKQIESCLNIEPEKVVVIRHTSDLPLLSTKKVFSKKLVTVARLDNKQKRIDLVIKAMVYLPDYELNIYGDGKDKKMLEDLTRSLSLNNVNFRGFTSEPKLAMDESSIHIMTSDFEGYGITNIEALRRGLPLIIRNTFPAASDLIDGNGCLLDKEWCEREFINAVKDIENNYDTFSLRSLELAKRYDFEEISFKWKDLIYEN